jgi:hypothetical protein
MTKWLLSLALLVAVSLSASGQSIFTNPITGTDPGLSNPYTTGQTFDPNISVTGIGRGVGASGNVGTDRYNTASYNTVAFDATAYINWILIPVASEIDFTNLTYSSQASGSGPTSFAIRSSADGFATNIAAPGATGGTINLSGSLYQNVTTAIEFRLYGWGASAAGGTFSVNDFTFNGTVTPVPEPATLLGVLAVGGLAWRRFRRR